MKLARLTTENIRGLPDRAHVFTDRTGAPLDTVLITGAPGSGKTTLLEAIGAVKEAIGSYGGPQNPTRLRRSGASRARIDVVWTLSPAERASAELESSEIAATWSIGDGDSRVACDPRVRRLFTAYSHAPEQGKFEYLPASRRLDGPRSRIGGSSPSVAAEGRLRLADDPEKYAGLRAHLSGLAVANAARLAQLVDAQGIAMRSQVPDALAAYKNAIAQLLPGLRLVAVEPDERSARVQFQKREGAIVELSELSESERQAVLLGATFCRLGLNHSVVLIDTPELHQHPQRHAEVFAAVCALGRDNQIIAATTSAELLSAARPDQVIDLSSARA
jgi:energy-coupling factor transporter ATP-binding protein EcfA2